MSILHVLFPVLLLLLLAAPGDGTLLHLIDSLACKGKHGRCRKAFCFLNERRIGMCTFSRRFCCRRKK
uniref:Beta-defensin-like domain-containing protein n=1 Tax=Chrysemys picta bellii TaxID=8478 RepID=A0A8C3I7D4_CHRPI